MALPLHLFVDDQKLAESDFDEYVVWYGEDYPAFVTHRGESTDYAMSGRKARRRIVAQLRRNLFQDVLPKVGDTISFEGVVYRIKSSKPDAVLMEYECEEEDS